MTVNFKYFIGVDISKKVFDLTIYGAVDSISEHMVFDNKKKGFNQFIDWIRELYDCEISEILICMENTGMYHKALATFLSNQGFSVWVENPHEIKWSLGIQRGKNDKADSKRIMEYAKRHSDKYKAYCEKSKDLQKIEGLLALRRRLISNQKALKAPCKELKQSGLDETFELINEYSTESINVLAQSIKKVEKAIKNIISKNKHLKEIYGYVTSVKCVGFVAACHLMIHTNCFTKFNSAKQLASYCGIAPFEYSSGSSVKGRTRVHHMANKQLKTILHMCAISSVAHNEEMIRYYRRKVDKEGKNKMTVLNAIRNKVLSRIFSCVKNQRHYTMQLTR